MQLPPQPAPLFAYSAERLLSRTEQLIAANKALVDRVVQNVSVEDANFANVLLPLQQGKDAMTLELYPIGFLRSVSTDEDIRNAAGKAEKLLSDYRIESSMREDVFKLVDAVHTKQKDDPALDAESRYLLGKEYNSAIRTGLALPSAPRDRLKEINKRLPELNGVPADKLEMLEKGQQGSEYEGKLRVSFKRPVMMPIREHCTVAETRRRV
ncbi:hypothetical protein NLG97_g10784 [Lecanicillium saksenae]|uniref:Uncharacterized protein n=1 Tax=Lecanicillium saksenae TaxID=468837 RepID=A0ACC1QCD4_9HYPO|nr:hypothetical protein NLG97_g10784 [Lecanicillium saksenae]